MTPLTHDAAPLNLKQVARRLGVHYMTAYRYVRQGVLPARRDGNVWMVEAGDVEAFGSASVENQPGRDGADWVERFGRHLLRGDEVGAWTVVAQALAAGQSEISQLHGTIGSLRESLELALGCGDLVGLSPSRVRDVPQGLSQPR